MRPAFLNGCFLCYQLLRSLSLPHASKRELLHSAHTTFHSCFVGHESLPTIFTDDLKLLLLDYDICACSCLLLMLSQLLFFSLLPFLVATPASFSHAGTRVLPRKSALAHSLPMSCCTYIISPCYNTPSHPSHHHPPTSATPQTY